MSGSIPTTDDIREYAREEIAEARARIHNFADSLKGEGDLLMLLTRPSGMIQNAARIAVFEEFIRYADAIDDEDSPDFTWPHAIEELDRLILGDIHRYARTEPNAKQRALLAAWLKYWPIGEGGTLGYRRSFRAMFEDAAIGYKRDPEMLS